MVNLDTLQIGSVFLYYGPRRFLRRRGLAVARVIALDRVWGVIHVRTFRESNDDSPEVDIGHIPITESRLARSIHSVHGAQTLNLSSLQSVSIWRERRARGEVGAFDVPLWEAEQLAWSAVPDDSPENVFIEHAFPKPSADGELSVVEVSCVS